MIRLELAAFEEYLRSGNCTFLEGVLYVLDEILIVIALTRRFVI